MCGNDDFGRDRARQESAGGSAARGGAREAFTGVGQGVAGMGPRVRDVKGSRGGESVEGGEQRGRSGSSTIAKRILFVCIGNSCRSQMAEGFARALGGSAVAAFSAGSRPEGLVNPAAIRVMSEIGIDISEHRSKGLDALPRGAGWDWIVTMGCGEACPALPARHRLDWNIPDPWGADDARFREVRDTIEREVRSLLAAIDSDCSSGR
jgi:arsenate reductase